MSGVAPYKGFQVMNCVKSVQNSEFFLGPYFPAFGLNTEKYGPEKYPYLDTFHAVEMPSGEII